MSKIKLLSKLDLAVIEKNNGKKRCQAVFTPKRFMPLLDYDKVLDKLNELVEAVNRLEEKMAKPIMMIEENNHESNKAIQ